MEFQKLNLIDNNVFDLDQDICKQEIDYGNYLFLSI